VFVFVVVMVFVGREKTKRGKRVWEVQRGAWAVDLEGWPGLVVMWVSKGLVKRVVEVTGVVRRAMERKAKAGDKKGKKQGK
jgi:hypothetical protein